MQKKITIELTESEVKLFRWFKRYKAVWITAKKLKPGSLVLHFRKEEKGEFPTLAKKEFHFYEKEGKGS